jgi:hypothetical protein
VAGTSTRAGGSPWTRRTRSRRSPQKTPAKAKANESKPEQESKQSPKAQVATNLFTALEDAKEDAMMDVDEEVASSAAEAEVAKPTKKNKKKKKKPAAIVKEAPKPATPNTTAIVISSKLSGPALAAELERRRQVRREEKERDNLKKLLGTKLDVLGQTSELTEDEAELFIKQLRVRVGLNKDVWEGCALQVSGVLGDEGLGSAGSKRQGCICGRNF